MKDISGKPPRRLPVRIKNLLRGSHSAAAQVSDLRRTLDTDLFPALVDALPLFRFRGHPLLPTFGSGLDNLRTSKGIFSPIPIDREFAWIAVVFHRRGEILNQFISLKRRLEEKLFLGDFPTCEKLIEEAEDKFGFSFWLLESRLAVLQMGKGLEAQKSYSSKVRAIRPEGDIISFLAYFLSWRNEETANPNHFKKRITDQAADWNVGEAFRKYMIFRLTGDSSLDRRSISMVLRYEASFFLIDYYETFIRLATMYLSTDDETLRPAFESSLKSLIPFISDTRINKLHFLASLDGADSLRQCPTRDLSCDEALLKGNYEELTAELRKAFLHRPTDVRVWYHAAITALDCGTALVDSEGLGGRFSRLLRSAMAKESDLAERVLDGARLALNYRSFPSSAEFDSFFKPQLSSEPLLDKTIQLAAFLSSPYLDPAVLRFLPSERRAQYGRILDDVYGSSQVISFEKWRAGEAIGQEENESLRANVDPLLLLEIQVEQAAAAGQYKQALALSRQLTSQAGARYRRIADRWTADCLFQLGNIDQAIEYVCERCISDADIITMMPIARCADALDKVLRARLAARLSTSIVLDIYTRQFDSRLESERNYAYEDFLTAHGVERPSQLRDKLQEFEHDFLIYYLHFICVPEVMQMSTAFSSSRELDEERLAVCKMLAEIDKDNREIHEMAIREITRKLAVRRGVREVEQSKLSVDMLAIRRWADKSLRESFVRYQTLLNAGLDAAGAGIQSALRNILTGAPVSEEYLHLPKNELSDLLVNMLTDFFQQCFTNPAHGLDCYLSMRIRHGALSGQLRAPLEQEGVIFQREGPGGPYKSNDYWDSQLAYCPQETLRTIESRLSKFSADFDNFVDQIANDYIQIRSSDKPNGLFHPTLNALQVRAIASDISTKSSFEDFLNLCTDLFWQLIALCLQNVHATIERRVKPEMVRLFEGLRNDLKKLGEPSYWVPQLDAAILNAQTKAQQALEQVKDWFKVSKGEATAGFSFEEMVDIGLESVSNIHPDFHPEVAVQTPPNMFFEQLSLFSDIFFIVFDNVRKHSGMLNPKVSISATVVGNTLRMKIVNELAAAAISPERESGVLQIKEAISQGGYLRAVRSEGGSGLKKLSNIMRREGNKVGVLDFGFLDETFFVLLEIPFLALVALDQTEAANA